MGALITVTIFLASQTVAGVWWASSISSAVSTMDRLIVDIQADVKEENLRQWTRINDNETALQQALANEQALEVALTAVQNTVSELRYDVRQTNNLIREVLSDKDPKE